jgi:hypothetical protein
MKLSRVMMKTFAVLLVVGFAPPARVVLLRTWGNPLVTQSGGTFGGGELPTSGFLNVGLGLSAPLSGTRTGATSFWGLHAAVGM